MSTGTSRPIVPGLILIVLGILFLLGNIGAINERWGDVGTWVVILLGAAFWLGFIFDRSRQGLIMPGMILLTIGIALNLSVRYDWPMVYLTPFFILAPAFGFYAQYLLGARDRGSLVPAVILTIIGLVYLMMTLPVLRYLGPIVMIVVGVMLLARRGRGAAQP